MAFAPLGPVSPVPGTSARPPMYSTRLYTRTHAPHRHSRNTVSLVKDSAETGIVSPSPEVDTTL